MILVFFKFSRQICRALRFVPPILQPFYFPSCQTLTSEYYIKVVLEKAVKPLTLRQQVTGDLRKESC